MKALSSSDTFFFSAFGFWSIMFFTLRDPFFFWGLLPWPFLSFSSPHVFLHPFFSYLLPFFFFGADPSICGLFPCLRLCFLCFPPPHFCFLFFFLSHFQVLLAPPFNFEKAGYQVWRTQPFISENTSQAFFWFHVSRFLIPWSSSPLRRFFSPHRCFWLFSRPGAQCRFFVLLAVSIFFLFSPLLSSFPIRFVASSHVFLFSSSIFFFFFFDLWLHVTVSRVFPLDVFVMVCSCHQVFDVKRSWARSIYAHFFSFDLMLSLGYGTTFCITGAAGGFFLSFWRLVPWGFCSPFWLPFCMILARRRFPPPVSTWSGSEPNCPFSKLSS